MARRPMIKDLPPIQEAFQSFQGFPPGFSRQQALTSALRICAQNLQKDDPRPFYSIREVAGYLSVPLRTTALSFKALDSEGLLHLIRGSCTMLAGKRNASRQSVKGIVGLPICLTAMITSPFECELQMQLDEQLRARGFVADSIFFHAGEECEPDFTKRLLRHNLGILVWLSPHPLSTHVLMSLRERGIRLILLHAVESPVNVSCRSYACDWSPAYMQMAEHWQSRGIERVIIPTSSNLLARRATKILSSILENQGLEVLPVEATEKALRSDLFHAPDKAPSRKKSVIAFMELQAADYLCNGYPELVENISSHMHLAFCRGAVRIPRLATKRVGVDVVQLEAEQLVTRVVQDLCDPQVPHEGLRGSFLAEYAPQIIMKSPHEREPL